MQDELRHLQETLPQVASSYFSNADIRLMEVNMRWAMACVLAFCAGLSVTHAAEPLALEAKIALGNVAGRIDHLAIDLARQRLFVAELGNNSVGVVDLKERRLLRTISGLKQPQGVGYHQSTDTLYVTNAGDGSVRIFRGPDYSEASRIDLKDDADNIRLDGAANRMIVGYGSGALAVIDPDTRRKIADIPLKAHPEGFQLDAKSRQIFVNVPDAKAISVVDLATGQQKTSWPITGAGSNFPMAIDEASSQVIVAFRNPAKLRSYSMQTGKVVNELDICGDSDDVFFDAKRKRLYVSCGEGFIDVIDASGAYKRVARIPTVSGARTSLFVPELERLFLAVRTSGREAPAVWIYSPVE
jgi:DNA-binding beta-propeller fold protein YncE